MGNLWRDCVNKTLESTEIARTQLRELILTNNEKIRYILILETKTKYGFVHEWYKVERISDNLDITKLVADSITFQHLNMLDRQFVILEVTTADRKLDLRSINYALGTSLHSPSIIYNQIKYEVVDAFHNK